MSRWVPAEHYPPPDVITRRVLALLHAGPMTMKNIEREMERLWAVPASQLSFPLTQDARIEWKFMFHPPIVKAQQTYFLVGQGEPHMSFEQWEHGRRLFGPPGPPADYPRDYLELQKTWPQGVDLPPLAIHWKDEPSRPPAEKLPAAVELGRRGGKKGGPARAKKLSREERSAIASKAAAARWERVRHAK